MSALCVTIDGKDITVESGATILEAARTAGIDIPTLCHHPALNDIGACRMCLVEIAGVPALQPACTYPVADGMVVQTESERSVQMRKFVLEMLFSERNHYCMFCEMSGDCELQAQAYRHGLAHWTYPTPNPRLPVDASRRFFLMDHNRCILCRRCIRACSDVVGNHTLGVMARGAHTMVTADMDQPFGDSTCVSCGTCLQVCPTGALVDRRSAYMGRHADVQTTESACAFCSVGCAITVVTRNGRPLRVEGGFDGPNAGVLCARGRFECLEGRERVAQPMVRRNGELTPATWDEATTRVADAFRAARPGAVHAWMTAVALTETMDAMADAFRNRLGAEVSLLSRPPEGPLPNGGALADIDAADRILVVGGDLRETHPVVAYRIQRAADHDAAITLVADGPSSFSAMAHEAFPMARLNDACKECQDAARPVIVYSADLPPEARQALSGLSTGARLIPLHSAANMPNALTLGLGGAAAWEECDLLYVLLQDGVLTEEQRERARSAAFVVLHAAYRGPDDDLASVLLPAPLWHERAGTFAAMDGRRAVVKPSTRRPESVWPEAAVFEGLAARV
ncbi:MAG TPA: 2Fe-2S iron-sulfur cluster-binding protein [Armatimonadota bacterium]|jgi:formate dehydrogenase major subunit